MPTSSVISSSGETTSVIPAGPSSTSIFAETSGPRSAASISWAWVVSSPCVTPISSGNSSAARASSPRIPSTIGSLVSSLFTGSTGASNATSSGLAAGSSMISTRSITSSSSPELGASIPSSMGCNSKISPSASFGPSTAPAVSNPSTNLRIGSLFRGFVMVPSALAWSFSSSISSSKGPPKRTKGTLFRSGSPLSIWQSSFPFLSGMVTSAMTKAGLNNFIFKRASSPFSEKMR